MLEEVTGPNGGQPEAAGDNGEPEHVWETKLMIEEYFRFGVSRRDVKMSIP